jgi:F-type H+-transporting ATPase subunit a
MAGNLPEPVLISTLLGLDHVAINGKSVEFKHVFYTWCAMGGLFGLGLFLRRRLTLVPGTVQNVAETVVDGLEQFTVNTIGEEGREFFPLLCGIFLFVLVQNLFGLLPGFDAPTANVNTNAAMALFVFLYSNYQGIKRWKFGYIGHFTGPMPFLAPLMFPLEVVSHAVRPVSLTLRLFGNIRGEEIVLVIFFFMAPVVSTFPVYFLFLLAKVLQAFIFFMLSMIYLKGALDHAH